MSFIKVVDYLELEKIFNKLFIIDGSYMLHRQLKQPAMFDLRNSNGMRTGGIFGFMRSLNKEILKCSDYFPVVVFDHGLSQRRLDIYDDYKNAKDRNNQPELITPEEIDNDYVTQYRNQRNLLASMLPFAGIPVIMLSGWEGDDLIYIISKMTDNSIILTDDRDMLQLLDDNINVRRAMADEFITKDSFLESKGFIDTFDFVISKAILGDTSDNIDTACKGVGDKFVLSMVRIIKRYSVDRYKNEWYIHNYPENEDDMKTLCDLLDVGYRKAFLNFDKDLFIRNMALVDLQLVEYDDNIISSIKATICNSNSFVNFFKFVASLGQLGITEVNIDTILQAVSSRYKNMLK